MSKNLVIFGAGGLAREVAWNVGNINREHPGTWALVGFLEHGQERIGQLLNGIPIIGADDVRRYAPGLYAVVAIGNSRARERAVGEAEALGCLFAALLHPSVQYDRDTVHAGDGTIICAGTIIPVNVTIGRHVIINKDCTIGHDSVIEDYVTISPGCHLGGYTTIRRSAFMGIGAVTIERVSIGAGAVVGAGAVIIRDVPDGVTAVGVPAMARGAK